MNLIDVNIGQRICKARSELELSKAEVADAIGEDIQTYSNMEIGLIRIMSEDLFKLSVFMKKPIEYFFPDHIHAPSQAINKSAAKKRLSLGVVEEASEAEISELLDLFKKIPVEIERRRILNMIRKETFR